MFSFKNISAVAFFLYGTTFIWMTASFVARTPAPNGTLWTIVNVLAIAAIVGFTIAAWGVYKLTSWWEPVAVVSAVIGLIAVVFYVMAINGEGQLSDPGVVMNIGIHVAASAAVIVVALVPAVHDWFTHRWA